MTENIEPTVYPCEMCNEELPEEDLTEFDGMLICEQCWEERIDACPECGCLFDNADDECGEIGTNWVCPDCYSKTFECFICGDREFDSNGTTVDGEVVCEHCYSHSSRVSECCECGESHLNENIYYYDGEAYCLECYDELETENDEDDYGSCRIRDYHDDPELHFYGDGKYHLGIELEVDDGPSWERESSAEKLLRIMGNHVYCSKDGSLNTGFEIITHPHTYEEMVSLPWEAAFTNLVSNGWKGHDTETAGLHIHIGRKCFDSDEALVRFCTFFENNWSFVRAFSRRTITSLIQWASRYMDDSETAETYTVKTIKEQTNKTCNRYKAVNLCKRPTVEVRIFKSTLKLSTFLAALEFTYLIAEKCNVITDEQAESFTPSEWLVDASENLQKYCAEQSIPLFITEPFEIEEEAA